MSQIKEQLEVVEEVENAEVVITTLNGLPGSWDSFIRRMCARSRIWEEHTQEEAQLIIRENNMGATEDAAITIQRRSLKR